MVTGGIHMKISSERLASATTRGPAPIMSPKSTSPSGVRATR